MKREKVFVKYVCGVMTYEVMATPDEHDKCLKEICFNNIWIKGERLDFNLGAVNVIFRLGEKH